MSFVPTIAWEATIWRYSLSMVCMRDGDREDCPASVRLFFVGFWQLDCVLVQLILV
jgi:hypothetical protein